MSPQKTTIQQLSAGDNSSGRAALWGVETKAATWRRHRDILPTSLIPQTGPSQCRKEPPSPEFPCEKESGRSPEVLCPCQGAPQPWPTWTPAARDHQSPKHGSLELGPACRLCQLELWVGRTCRKGNQLSCPLLTLSLALGTSGELVGQRLISQQGAPSGIRNLRSP